MPAQDTPTTRARKSTPKGIRKRHSKLCAVSQGGTRCSCTPTFEAFVGLGELGKRKRKTFASEKRAVEWRRSQLESMRRGRRHDTPKLTLRSAWAEFLVGAKSGAIISRGGARYRPSVLRSYDQVVQLYILPALGGMRLDEVTTRDLQRRIEQLRSDGLASSTIRNAMTPLRALYRRAVLFEFVDVNPTRSLTLPSGATRRAHGGDPIEAARMVAALPEQDRPIWAAAFYAGLRLGELRGLRWCDVDEKASLIRVRRSWDARAGEIEPKSAAGRRDVPILEPLRPHLTAARARCGWAGAPEGLVFGSTERTPFGCGGLYRRATDAFEAAGLPRITPHQARHSFASFLIASGVTVKALTTYMGHASSRLSLDTYGHMFPSEAAQDAAQINAWLQAADTQSRVAQLAVEEV